MKRIFTPILPLVVSLNVTNLAYAEDNAQSATSTTSSAVVVDSAVSATVAPISAVAPSTTPDPATLENSKATTQTREQMAKIIFDDDFSKKTQNKVWKEKNTAPREKSWLEKWLENRLKNRDSSSHSSDNAQETASLIGLIAKVIALSALMAGIFWIVKNADTWLAWFQGSKSRRRQSLPNADVASHYRQAFAPIWQGLPEKSRLTELVKEAVAKGDWLLALSTLYRGTLREIVDIYDLPITRATTERQGEWLLQKQNVQPQETQFFQQLIDMWAKVAYGQQRPNSEQVSSFSQTINQLATTWDSLYLHRQSPLEKRHWEKRHWEKHYQQLEQPTGKAVSHTKTKPNKAGGN